MNATLVMVNGTETLGRTRVTTVMVVELFGGIVPWVKLTDWPLTVTVPAVALAEMISNSSGIVSEAVTFVSGVEHGFVMVIVQVTVAPGRAKAGLTDFVTVGPQSPPPPGGGGGGGGGGWSAKPKSKVWSFSPKSPVVRLTR
jgi:hypothetical protein